MPVEEPVVLYKLRSMDHTRFLVDRRTVAMIGRLDDLFKSAGLDIIPADQLEPIQLELSATVLRKVIEWCDHHKFDPPFDESAPDSGELPDWDANFLMVRHRLLFDIIRAAKDFHVPGLFAMCCRVVSQNPREIIDGLLEDDVEVEQENRQGRRFNYRAAAA
uniref:Skp1-related protein n=1 Tax=Caenorhabditis tropicalis TaxID=1561998 RepID=A0A1I7TN87_9PELO